MFTVEQEIDHQKVVIMDDTAEFEDIEMYLDDDGKVFIRQFVPELDTFHLLTITYHQLIDLVASLDAPEGMYATELQPTEGVTRE